MSERDPTRPLPFAGAARGVFQIALEGMVWGWRTVVLGVLLGLPILLGLLHRVAHLFRRSPETTGFDLYGQIVTNYYIRPVLPLVALFFATALIADEVEGKTLTYLLSRPITRTSILAGKFAAYLVTTLCLAVPSLMATFFLLATDRGMGALGAAVPDLFRDVVVAALTLVSYGALFALFGVWLRRPLVPGLLFIFAWELLANLSGYLPRLTLQVYLRSLVRHRPAVEGLSELFGQVLPAWQCLAVLAGVTAACLATAFWTFSRREFVISQ